MSTSPLLPELEGVSVELELGFDAFDPGFAGAGPRGSLQQLLQLLVAGLALPDRDALARAVVLCHEYLPFTRICQQQPASMAHEVGSG